VPAPSPGVTAIDDGIRAVAGPSVAVLHASVPVRGEDLHTVAEFTISQGERVWFTLTWGESFKPDPRPIDAEQALKDTGKFWTRWSSQLKYKGEYAGAVERSLITLKAMTFSSHRRPRRLRHHLAAGIHREHTQLGLPLLLAP